jgi:hypothetical protein
MIMNILQVAIVVTKATFKQSSHDINLDGRFLAIILTLLDGVVLREGDYVCSMDLTHTQYGMSTQ